MNRFSIEIDEQITKIRLEEMLSLRKVLEVIDEVARSGVTNRRLWDLTENFTFTADEIARIASRGRELWPAAARVAYVAADSLSFGLLRMFEVFREQENYETKVFRDEHDALAWLRSWVE